MLVLDNRFGKCSRLLNSVQFREVFARGRRHRTNYFTAIVKCSHGEIPRLGLAVSKKKMRLAVRRNRMKRIIRESFRLNQQRFAGSDLVVIPRASAGGVDSETLRASLEALWRAVERQCASR